MATHAVLTAAAAEVKHQYSRLRTWQAALLKESAQDLATAVAHADVGVEIENVLKRWV